jgi:hypothetical protein
MIEKPSPNRNFQTKRSIAAKIERRLKDSGLLHFVQQKNAF